MLSDLCLCLAYREENPTKVNLLVNDVTCIISMLNTLSIFFYNLLSQIDDLHGELFHFHEWFGKPSIHVNKSISTHPTSCWCWPQCITIYNNLML